MSSSLTSNNSQMKRELIVHNAVKFAIIFVHFVTLNSDKLNDSYIHPNYQNSVNPKNLLNKKFRINLPLPRAGSTHPLNYACLVRRRSFSYVYLPAGGRGNSTHSFFPLPRIRSYLHTYRRGFFFHGVFSSLLFIIGFRAPA